MNMKRRSISLSMALGSLMTGIAGLGEATLQSLATSAPPPSFGQRYGANPRSTGNGGNGRGAVARMKRAARRRNNIRKHARG